MAIWIDYADAQRGFNERIDNIQRDLAHRFGSTEAVLTALVGLHHATDSLKMDEFTGLSRELVAAYPHVRTIARIVAIPADERAEFEKRMREGGFVNFQVTERKRDGTLARAENRPITMPIRLFVPLEPEYAGQIGYDVRSDPRLFPFVVSAVTSGRVVASDLITMSGFESGVFVFKAYYLGYDQPKTRQARQAQIGGLVALNFDPARMFQDIIARNPGYNFRLTADGNTAPFSGAPEDFAPGMLIFNHTQRAPALVSRIFDPFVAYVPITRLGKSFILKIAKWPNSGEIRIWLAIVLMVIAAVACGLLVLVLRSQRIGALNSRRGEQILQESRERFRDYAEISSDWFWATDKELQFTYFSKQAGKATGMVSQDTLENLQQDLAAQLCSLSANDGPDGRVTPQRTFRDMRYRFTDENGQQQWWSVSGKPVFGPNGEFEGYRGTGRNVTIEVEASRALEAAKEEAELANRMKSEFIANMSHELRTPLNAVIGFSEMIKSEAYGAIGDSRYAEYAGNIHNSGVHLLSVINDILDLSKVESGKEELIEEEVDFVSLANSILALLNHQADEVGVRLECLVPENFPRLRVDERKLKQILVNLLNNAIKFTPTGGQVTLTANCRPGDGPCLEVRDTGIGIANDDIPTAFSKFRQIDSDLNRQYEGTGLGLPLAKGLTELHGGTLTLNSRVGHGTTVTVRLPRGRIVENTARNDSELPKRPETKLLPTS